MLACEWCGQEFPTLKAMPCAGCQCKIHPLNVCTNCEKSVKDPQWAECPCCFSDPDGVFGEEFIKAEVIQ